VDCVVHVSAPRPSALRIIQRPRTSFSFSGKPQQQTQQTQPFGLQIWDRNWRGKGSGNFVDWAGMSPSAYWSFSNKSVAIRNKIVSFLLRKNNNSLM
jgi:hypothetical protein